MSSLSMSLCITYFLLSSFMIILVLSGKFLILRSTVWNIQMIFDNIFSFPLTHCLYLKASDLNLTFSLNSLFLKGTLKKDKLYINFQYEREKNKLLKTLQRAIFDVSVLRKCKSKSSSLPHSRMTPLAFSCLLFCMWNLSLYTRKLHWGSAENV